MGMHMVVRSLGHIALRQFRISAEHAARRDGQRRRHIEHHAAEFCAELFLLLAEKLDSSGLHSLIILDGSEKKIVKGVIDAAKTKDVEILTLNSMQSSIGDDDTYLSIMEDNLSVLQKALN